MSKTEFLVRLRDLHEELSSINLDLKENECIDDETVEALGQLVTDVGVLVDQVKARNSQEVESSFREGHQTLHEQLVNFNCEHPRVSGFITRLSDLLAMIGI